MSLYLTAFSEFSPEGESDRLSRKISIIPLEFSSHSTSTSCCNEINYDILIRTIIIAVRVLTARM